MTDIILRAAFKAVGKPLDQSPEAILAAIPDAEIKELAIQAYKHLNSEVVDTIDRHLLQNDPLHISYRADVYPHAIKVRVLTDSFNFEVGSVGSKFEAKPENAKETGTIFVFAASQAAVFLPKPWYESEYKSFHRTGVEYSNRSGERKPGTYNYNYGMGDEVQTNAMQLLSQEKNLFELELAKTLAVFSTNPKTPKENIVRDLKTVNEFNRQLIARIKAGGLEFFGQFALPAGEKSLLPPVGEGTSGPR